MKAKKLRIFEWYKMISAYKLNSAQGLLLLYGHITLELSVSLEGDIDVAIKWQYESSLRSRLNFFIEIPAAAAGLWDS